MDEALYKYGAIQIAKILSQPQKIACVRLSDDFVKASDNTFQSNSAKMLCEKYHGVVLAERKEMYDKSVYAFCWFYKLTEAGKAVKDILKYQGYS